jgi:O-antigen ligase
MPTLILILPSVGITLAWFMPLHLLPWVSWHSELSVFASVFATAIWAAGALIIQRGWCAPMFLPSMVWALLAAGALALLQASVGLVTYWGDAWAVTIYALLCACAFSLGHGAAGTEARLTKCLELLAATVLLAGVGCSTVALIQAFDIWPTWEWIARTPTWRRPGSNLAQANHMGTLVLMGLVGLVYLYERANFEAIPAALLAGILGVGLMTTESRTALLSLVVLGGWWCTRRSASRLHLGAVITMLVFIVVGYFVWPQAINAFHGADPNAAGLNTAVGLRAIVWPQLLEAVLDRPWVGWGLRQTSSALSTVLDSQPVSEAYVHAHNLFLDTALGVGVPLAALVVAAGGLWLWRRRSARETLAGWLCFAMVLPFAVHAMLEFPHTYAYLLAPVFFALGVIDRARSDHQRVALPAGVVAAGLAAVVSLASWTVLEYISIEEDFRVARFEAGRIGSTPSDYIPPKVHVLTQLGALLEGSRLVPTPGLSPIQIQRARDVAYRFPWPALQNRYALALALNGDPAEARRMLRVIRAMHGEKLYSEIRSNWIFLAEDRYPGLLADPIP